MSLHVGDRVEVQNPARWRGTVVFALFEMGSWKVKLHLDQGFTDYVWYHEKSLRVLDVVERIGELEHEGR